MTFRWQKSQGRVPVARYFVCVWPENRSSFCDTRQNGLLALFKGVPSTATTLRAGIGRRYQGKKLLWTVLACKGNDYRKCTASLTRRLIYAVPATVAGATPRLCCILGHSRIENQGLIDAYFDRKFTVILNSPHVANREIMSGVKKLLRHYRKAMLLSQACCDITGEFRQQYWP